MRKQAGSEQGPAEERDNQDAHGGESKHKKRTRRMLLDDDDDDDGDVDEGHNDDDHGPDGDKPAEADSLRGEQGEEVSAVKTKSAKRGKLKVLDSDSE